MSKFEWNTLVWREMLWIFGGKECFDFSTALGLAKGLGKHSGAKAVKRSGRRCCIVGAWSSMVQRQHVRHIFWSFLLWSIAFIHSLLSSCLLITLQQVSKCYWLCFEWHFEWFRIGIIDWNHLNEKMDIWNVCSSRSRFCNTIIFHALFDTCTIYIKKNWCQKLASLNNYK
jgi:hypothetical protein